MKKANQKYTTEQIFARYFPVGCPHSNVIMSKSVQENVRTNIIKKCGNKMKILTFKQETLIIKCHAD